MRSVRTIDPARKEKKRSFRQGVEDGEAASASGRAASTQSAGCHPRSALEEYTLLFRLSVCKRKVVCFHLRSDFALFGGDLLAFCLSFLSCVCMYGQTPSVKCLVYYLMLSMIICLRIMACFDESSEPESIGNGPRGHAIRLDKEDGKKLIDA